MLQRVAAALSISISTVRLLNLIDPFLGHQARELKTKAKPVWTIDNATETSIFNVIYEMYRISKY